MLKKSKPTVPTFTRTSAFPVTNSGKIAEIERFAGRGNAEVFNREGIALGLDAVLMRSRVDPFHLYVRLGDRWFDVMTIVPDDPAFAELADRIEVFGPSAMDLEKARKREAEARARLEAEQAAQAKSVRKIYEAQLAAETKRRSDLAARQ